MRSLRPALMVMIVACAPATDAPATTPPPPETATTSSPTPTTTTTTVPDLKVVLSEEEAVAVDQGVRLEVRGETGVILGWVERDHPGLEVDASNRWITLNYLTPDGSPTDVVWTQQADQPVRQPWRGQGECRANLPDGSTSPVRLAWQAGGTSSTYLEQLDGAGTAVNVVSPIWWRMGADGALVSTADPGYVRRVHQRNIAVWPAVAGFDADTHHLVLANPVRRSAMAHEVSDEARRIGADGVNIDLEGYRERDADAFAAFVEELAGLVHSWGGVVSYDLVPRSDTWDVTPEDLAFWSTAPDRARLSRATDCTILMAYDQHNRYRPAGPVASPAWVEEALAYELRHADPAELVLGIPLYARIWDPDELDRPAAVGIGKLQGLIEEGEMTHDPVHGLDRVDLPDGRFFWAETPAGLQHRFDLVERYGLAGWAAWRFGFDSPAVWDSAGSRDS